VKIVDHSAPGDDFHFYVMPFREAKSLQSLVRTDANPYFRQPLAALDMFRRIVEGIQACEQTHLVHRDLSPANILIHPDQSITIIDFGLCQVAEAETITLVDEGVGTQNYMAPECESGSDGIVSSCADLYSAGKILWAAITNNQAFSRESPAFTSKSLRALFPDHPMTWHLHHVFERTIRHKREDRFSNAEQALVTVRLVRHLITSSRPPLAYLKEWCPICGWGRLGELSNRYGLS
jgi:serine/threonine protein kinase